MSMLDNYSDFERYSDHIYSIFSDYMEKLDRMHELKKRGFLCDGLEIELIEQWKRMTSFLNLSTEELSIIDKKENLNEH